MKTIGYRIEIIHPQINNFSGFTTFLEGLTLRESGNSIISETINPEKAVFLRKRRKCKRRFKSYSKISQKGIFCSLSRSYR